MTATVVGPDGRDHRRCADSAVDAVRGGSPTACTLTPACLRHDARPPALAGAGQECLVLTRVPGRPALRGTSLGAGDPRPTGIGLSQGANGQRPLREIPSPPEAVAGRVRPREAPVGQAAWIELAYLIALTSSSGSTTRCSPSRSQRPIRTRRRSCATVSAARRGPRRRAFQRGRQTVRTYAP